MDFLERLVDTVNNIDGLPIRCEPGYLKEVDSFCAFPIPGSRVTQEYFNGVKEESLNYEFQMKSKVQGYIHSTLWLVQTALEGIADIVSNDGSFEFQDLEITNKPYPSSADDQGWYGFSITIQAKITTFNNKESVKNG